MALLEALLFATTVLAAGASRCTEPPRIASGVAALHGQVVEAESFTVAELRDRARQHGAAMAHAPLGFYAAKFGHGYQVHTETQASADGTQCGTLTTVTVRLVLIDRAVVVARDLRERGCDHDAVVRHYTKHALADDRVLSRQVLILHQALVAAWPAIREQLPSSGAPDEAELRRVMGPVVTKLVDAAEKDRLVSIAEVDNDAEVIALAASCTTKM